MPLAPIAIFAYNRPDKARELIQALQKCPEFVKSEVFVFIDGYREASQKILVEEVEYVFKKSSHPDIKIYSAERNLGLKLSLTRGISKVLANYDSVIVLEDDLVVSPDILTYFNKALAKYALNKEVYSICADLPNECAGLSLEAKFLPSGSSWGWATWASRWKQFSLDHGDKESYLSNQDFCRRLDAYGQRDFVGMLQADQTGLISSWYVHWQFTIALNGGVSVFPPRPLVKNSGFSGGTHAGRLNLFKLFNPQNKTLGHFDFTLPDEVVVDWKFHKLVIDSWEWRLLRWNSILGSLKRRLSKRLHPIQ